MKRTIGLGGYKLGGYKSGRLHVFKKPTISQEVPLEHTPHGIKTNLRTQDLKSQNINNPKESDSNQDHRTLDHSSDCEAQQLAIEHRRLAVGVPKHGEQKKSEAQETATVSDLAPVEQKSGWPKSGRGKEAVN